MDAVAGVDDARDVVLPCVADELPFDGFGDGARAVVREDDAVGFGEDAVEVAEHGGFGGAAHGCVALTVKADDLLADGGAAARDDAGFRDGRALGVAQEAARIDTGVLEHGRDAVSLAVVADEADGRDAAAEGRAVVHDVCRAARNDFFARLLEHEHGGFARDAGDAAVDVDVGDHVADDEDAAAGKAVDEGGETWRRFFLLHEKSFLK